MGKGKDGIDCGSSVGMNAVFGPGNPSERDLAVVNLFHPIQILLRLEADGLDMSWLDQDLRAQMDDILCRGLELDFQPEDGSLKSVRALAESLGMPKSADKKDVVRCMMARWMRGNGYTKGFIREYLFRYGDSEPRISTIEKWCGGVGFLEYWPSRTEGQPMRGGAEAYQQQRQRWRSKIADIRALTYGTKRTAKAAIAYRKQAEREVRKILEDGFYKLGLSEIQRKDQKTLEKIFSQDTAEDLLEEIIRIHARGTNLVEKPMEDALAHAIGVGAGLEVKPRNDRSADADIEVALRGKNVSLQVKTSTAYDPLRRQKHATGYEDETKTSDFTLFSTGDKKAKNPAELSRKASDRISKTDLYVMVNVIHENQGITPGYSSDTTKYAFDVIRSDVKKEIAKAVKGHQFKPRNPCVMQGMVEQGGRMVPWRAEAFWDPGSKSVKLRNISATCIETVATITLPSPEACQAMIGARSYELYRAAKKKS